MQPMKDVLGELMRGKAAEQGDYLDKEGFLVCGKCHTRKQYNARFPAMGGRGERICRVSVPCKCQREEHQAQEDQKRRLEFVQRMESLRRDGITDRAYLQYTFAQDDRRNPQRSEVCRRYVEAWEEMRDNNIGILFYGGVGTGKSFLACCIANALLEKLVSVNVTNFPRILNRLQKAYEEDRQALVDRLQQYSLLVLDDLGVERDTSYSMEQVFYVVDTRLRSGKPLIVTTNLTLQDLNNPPDLAHKRVYDRVLEMCPVRLKLTGDSRRAEIASEREEKARKIMGLK